MKNISDNTVPKIGECIFVPSISGDETSSCGWTKMKKKGGTATVGSIQQVNDTTHLIFVIEYGGFGMWWENYLAPMQQTLAEEYNTLSRAQFLN